MALTKRTLLHNVSFREDRNSVTPARFGEILVSLTDSLRTVEGRSALLHGVAAAVFEIVESTVELAAVVNMCGTTYSIELSDRWDGIAHSALCIPVRVAGSEIGVLELHSAEPYAFDHAGVELVGIMAHAVGGAIADQTQLTSALDSERGLRDAISRRAPIEQAKGILMALNQITEDEAFSVLSAKSQEANTKLAIIAARFVETASSPQPEIA